MNEHEKAEDVFAKSVVLLPNDPTLWSWYGINLHQQEKYNEAIKPFQNALKLEPTNINALSTLPVALEELGLFAQSDSVYEAGIKLLPDNALLLNNYAYTLSERDMQLRRALEMSTKANKIIPENAAYLDTMGWIYFRMKNYPEAKKYIMASINIRSDSAVVLDHLGDVYYELNDIEQAKIYWKKSIEILPDNPTIKDKITNN